MRKFVLIAALFLIGCAGVSGPVLPPGGPSNQMMAQCADGSLIQLDMYKTDTGSLIVFKREGKLVGLMDSEKHEVYVYAEKKTYSVEAVQAKYPTPCDLPLDMGTGV